MFGCGFAGGYAGCSFHVVPSTMRPRTISTSPVMPEISPSRYMVNAGWDDVPHLDEKAKRELLESTPPYLQDAVSKGLPSLGAGAVWPIALSDVLVDPFPIPPHWPRA